MQSIIRPLGERVLCVLSGFDRLLFRGFLRCVINPRGLNGYLYGAGIRMADFGARDLTKAGIGFLRHDNGIYRVDDHDEQS